MEEYLRSLSDVDLLLTMLEAARSPPVSRRMQKAFEDISRERGPERMEAARATLGEQREAERCMVLVSEEAAHD